ncbi:MAG: hypothetical protein ACYCRE_10155 [Acidobacteriaceae bacterium]
MDFVVATETAKNQDNLPPANAALRTMPGPPQYPRAHIVIVASNDVDKVAPLAEPSLTPKAVWSEAGDTNTASMTMSNAECRWWIWSVVLRKRSTWLAIRGIRRCCGNIARC